MPSHPREEGSILLLPLLLSVQHRNVQRRRQGLLKLSSLLRIIDDEGVEVTRAANLELGHVAAADLLWRLLDAGGWRSAAYRRGESIESVRVG